MANMEYVFADTLSPEQLMEEDAIKFEDEIVIVKDVVELKEGYLICATNDFGEELEFIVSDNTKLEWYVIQD